MKTTDVALTYEELTKFLEYLFAGSTLADQMADFGHCNGFSCLFMNAMRQGKPGRTDFFRRIEIIKELLDIKHQTSSVNALNTVPERMQDLVQELISRLENQTNSQPPSFFVEEDRPILDDLLSFAHELVIYQDPASFPALFEGASKEPAGQATELTYPLMFSPKEYKKCSVEKLSVGIYDKKEFFLYFERLHKALQAKPANGQELPNPAISFLMGTTTHSISISYDTTTHTWFMANSEDIKKEFLIDGTKDTGQLAKWVYNALVRKDIDESIAFSSTLFADTTTVEAIKETLRKDAIWQAIHDPTRKNCSKLVSYNEVQLLHILVSEAELSTIAHLLEYAKKQSTQTNVPSFFNTTHFLDHLLNAQDKFGYTPLMFAIDKADLERVELLLNYRPDLNLKNKGTEQGEGQTALELAQHNLKHYLDSGGNNKQLIESYSKIIDTLENHLKFNPLINKKN
ncbi:hypothetical protein GH742_08955 [Legionella sp. MW5194]|uniref:ankyrin repeat domain-containing protein n=1 Tax=Legionella sp. MW5194 TaxID=2662448 RepID=UPI00193DED02|nr:ankyrin repeat domain-containing protein [Legionella sp. MW5194]QRN03985.1 hypothetical protein GH742_08955 [Legionella sp. MW5194]